MNYLKRFLLAAICMQISFQGLMAQTAGRLGAQGNDDVWCTESWTGDAYGADGYDGPYQADEIDKTATGEVDMWSFKNALPTRPPQ